MRLQVFLARAQVASRRQAEALIAAGEVTVNGDVVAEPGVQVEPNKDNIRVNGRRVRLDPPITRLLLKPRGCFAGSKTRRPLRGCRRWPRLRGCFPI